MSETETKIPDPTPLDRSLLMIPGPIEYESNVLSILGSQALSHVSPQFIKEFSSVIKNLRSILNAEKSQPLVLSGSGTLGWDCILANLVENGESVLVVNTGYFSDSFGECALSYGINVHQVKANNIGDTVTTEQLETALKQHSNVKMVLLTHVDTSTAVLNNIKELAKTVKEFNSNILVAVDGVCSFGGEQFEFDSWGIDAANTCSQKALGTPTGLVILLFSELALKVHSSRKSRVPAYFVDLKNWLPIMKAYELLQPSYFATPNVNLIRALNVSLNNILTQTMEKRLKLNEFRSKAFKAAINALGLKQVPTNQVYAANTLTAVYYPNNIQGPQLLAEMTKNNIIIAGGLHKEIKATYFRVGHMGISIAQHRTDVLKVVEALEKSLTAVGYKFEPGVAVNAYNQYKQQ